MDTLTHALSGALLARATARPQAAMPAWHRVTVCTVAAAFPDIDVLLGFVSPLAYLTGHRGVTHSLLMLPLWAALIGWLAARVARRREEWSAYALVAALGIGAHILGDLITSFGTMAFAPLSDARFGWGTTFVIDLWFSGIILAGLAASALRRGSRVPAIAACTVLAGYVGMQTLLKAQAEQVGRDHARARGLTEFTVETVPRPVSPFNWTVVVSNGERYHYAHVNLLRRDAPADAGADAGLIARIAASFQPVDRASWHQDTRFGGTAAEIALSRQAWSHPSFAFFRWFAELPALYRIDAAPEGPCVWFQDLRFLTPGRDAVPFRYGMCANGGQWQVFELLAGGLRRLLR